MWLLDLLDGSFCRQIQQLLAVLFVFGRELFLG